MCTAWDTQLSPGDARGLRANQFARDAAGTVFFGDRDKTGVPVGGALSDRTLRVHAAYLEKLGVELHGEAHIYRNRSGGIYSKDTLGDDFREVREAEFGKLDTRRLSDFRRSAAGEAIAGKADPAHLAHAMGNTLNTSNVLFATYCPINLRLDQGGGRG